MNLSDIVNINKECRIYIAGPMSGLPSYNYPKFLSVEADLRAMGYENILNPAKIANGKTGLCYSYYIRESLNLIKDADAVVFLDGWQNSKGAQLEYHCATTMNLKLFDERYSPLKPEKVEEDKRTVCEIADNLVSTERQKTYGHPYDNFKDIGRIWGTILNLEDIPPEKVGLMMIGVKIAREKFLPKRDNRIDLCGYAKTIDIIHQKKKELENE